MSKPRPPRLQPPLALPPDARAARVAADGVEVNLTHLDRPYFPDGAKRQGQRPPGGPGLRSRGQHREFQLGGPPPCRTFAEGARCEQRKDAGSEGDAAYTEIREEPERPRTTRSDAHRPATVITKRDLLDYSREVSEYLLPYLRDRPYTMKRYPGGVGEPPFFQKNAGPGTPAWVRTARVPSRNARGEVNAILCNDLATLLYVVNAGCIDHNVWMSRVQTPLQPDFVLLDLDPGPAASFAAVVRVALALRAVLEDAGIAAYPKTSGATGMHLWIPIAPGADFAQSQQLAARLLRLAAAKVPDLVTEVWSLAKRPRERIYLDYRQNAHGKTIPPPYSPRPRPGAPVSCPLLWSEVRRGLDPARFTIRTLPRRLEKLGDLFAPTLPGAGRQPLASLLARLDRQAA